MEGIPSTGAQSRAGGQPGFSRPSLSATEAPSALARGRQEITPSRFPAARPISSMPFLISAAEDPRSSGGRSPISLPRGSTCVQVCQLTVTSPRAGLRLPRLILRGQWPYCGPSFPGFAETSPAQRENCAPRPRLSTRPMAAGAMVPRGTLITPSAEAGLMRFEPIRP